jgi:hypothetical protein
MATRRKRPRKQTQETALEMVSQSGDTTRTISEIGDSESGARVMKYQSWIKQSLEVQERFAAAYIESMKILANDPEGHWSEKALNDLNAEGRPALIINHTTATVMTVAGLQRRSREIAKLLPGDPDDAEAVELLEYLYRWFYDQLGMKETDSSVFLKKYAGGLGFWKMAYDVSEDPRGVPDVTPVSPLSVLWDPNWPDVPWRDAEYVIHAEWRTVDKAIDEWPEYEEQIRHTTGEWIKSWSDSGGSRMGDTQAPSRFFWDPQTQRVRIAQVWYKRTRTAKVALWADGNVESDPKAIEAAEAAIRETEDADRAVQIVRQPVTRVYMGHLLDQLELDHRPTPMPFQKLPLVPSLGYFFWKRPVGAVEYMKDPQREKNKRRAVITEIAGRAAHSGFMWPKGSVDKEQMENYASGAGVGIEYEGAQAPTPITPPQLPQYLVYLEQQATADIRFVVNVNDELMGTTTAQTTSGRAIEARQRGGLLTQEIFFDSFSVDQAEVTKLIIEMIRDRVTVEEARRILGALVQRTQDETMTTALNKPPEALDLLLSRAFVAKFDVVVSTQPWDPSGKMAGLRTLEGFFNMPGLQPPPDLFIKLATQAGALSKSIGEEWLKRLQTPPPEVGAAPPPGGNGAVPPGMAPPVAPS